MMYILRYNKSKKIMETRSKKKECVFEDKYNGIQDKKKELVLEIEYG